MKLVQFKLAGFGLVALAGSALAANGDWLPVSAPGSAPSNAVVPAGGQPFVLPASLRLASSSEPAAAPEPLWLPSSKSTPPKIAHSPAPLPEMPNSTTIRSSSRPAAQPFEPASSQVPFAGPRVGIVPDAPARETPEWLPATPSIQEVRPAPVNLQPIPRIEDKKPPTSDSPVDPVKPMPPPMLPGTILPQPSGELPQPRPATTPKELPVAPPELMLPDCTPGKHGAFGSPGLRLGRDYPPLSELCGSPVRDWFASRFGGDRVAGNGGFIQGEYLLWWMPGVRVPILGTTNPDPNSFGFIGEPGTVPLLGPGEFIGPSRQGLRLRGGLWLDACATCGIDGSIFFLGKRTADASFGGSQYGIVTRPIFSPNIQPGIGQIGETGEAVTVPNVLAGALSVHAESSMWGADVNLRHCLVSGCDWKLMGFAGYRYLNLSEEVSITENILVVGTSPRIPITDPIGTTIFVKDSFKTVNQFNGGQVGLTYERRRGRWGVDGRASVAFGVTHQELDIFGTQVRTRPGQPPVTFRGGLLAAGPNLGSFSRDEFSVVPEFTFNVGYWATDSLKLYVGYNFLYWPNVIRPGDQIDGVVDLSFVPNSPAVPPSGQLRPQPLFKQSDLWVTGIQFGVEWRW